jgi:hypothetical protein
VAASHGRHLPPHFEAAVQLAPQDRAVRKHLQGNFPWCRLTRNRYDTNAIHCTTIPARTETLRRNDIAHKDRNCAESSMTRRKQKTGRKLYDSRPTLTPKKQSAGAIKEVFVDIVWRLRRIGSPSLASPQTFTCST